MSALPKMIVLLVTTGAPEGPVQCVCAGLVSPLAVFSAIQVRVYSLPAAILPVLEGLIRTMTGDGGATDKKRLIGVASYIQPSCACCQTVLAD